MKGKVSEKYFLKMGHGSNSALVPTTRANLFLRVLPKSVASSFGALRNACCWLLIVACICISFWITSYL
mgnify:FL=1